MIGHTYYNLWKVTTLTTINMIGHTYYHMWKGTTLTITSMVGLNHIIMALSPRLRIPGTSPGSSIPRMAVSLISGTKSEWLALTSYMEGTNPLTMTEWLSPYI